MPRASVSDGDGGEAGTLAQHAQAEADVLEQLLEPNNAPDLPGLFLDARHVAELAHSRIPRFFGRHAAVDVVLRLPLDMVANVLVEIVEHTLAAAHGWPSCSVGRRIRAMAPASLSHLRVSTVSCLRPLDVSR